MTWAEKGADWIALTAEIDQMLCANKEIIPAEHVSAIRHYLEHDELSSAFEYLVLELIERGVAQSDVDLPRLKELTLFFDLNDENECMIDGDFWPKFQKFVS